MQRFIKIITHFLNENGGTSSIDTFVQGNVSKTGKYQLTWQTPMTYNMSFMEIQQKTKKLAETLSSELQKAKRDGLEIDKKGIPNSSQFTLILRVFDEKTIRIKHGI